ncbi:MAG TPA: hypothetical protein P5277_04705 [Candidatus Paceibacterota bacterium]|nr:hypothetical protein [Candidatus Paceibacterota bacterium]
MKVGRTLRNIGLATLVGVGSMFAPKYAQAVEIPAIEWRTAALMTQSEYDQRNNAGTLPVTDLNEGKPFTDIDTAFDYFKTNFENISEPGVDLTVYSGSFSSDTPSGTHQVRYNLKMHGDRDNSEIIATLNLYKFADLNNLTFKGGWKYPEGVLSYNTGSSGNVTNCNIVSALTGVLEYPLDVIGNTFIDLRVDEGGVGANYNAIQIASTFGGKEDALDSLILIRDNQFLNENHKMVEAIDAGFAVNASALIEGGNNVFIDCPTVIYSRAPTGTAQEFAGNAWGMTNLVKSGNREKAVVQFYTDTDQIKELFVLPVEERPFVDVSNPLGYNPLADDDHDGLRNGDEINIYGTYSDDPDSDRDGLSDYDELNGTFGYVTDPMNKDTDCYVLNDLPSVYCDKISDGQEIIHGWNPLDPTDPELENNKVPTSGIPGLITLMGGVGLAGAAALRRKKK